MTSPSSWHRWGVWLRARLARGLTLRRTMTLAVVLGVVSPALILLVVEQRIAAESQNALLAQGKANVLAVGTAAIAESMWVLDSHALRQAASKLLDNHQVMAVRITESRPAGQSISVARDGAAFAYDEAASAQVEHQSRPVLRGEETLGTLHVWFDENYGQSLSAQRRNQMLLLVVLQVSVSLIVLMLVLGYRVLDPIERLKAQATGLLPDAGVRASVVWTRRDELGQLGRHLATVQAQLADLFGQLQRKNQQLHHLALYDQLTGLPNRSLFHDLVQREMQQCKRNQQTFGLLFIDLDRFKAVNDAMGHGVGDSLLIEISRRLRQTLREVDVVCRQSGDEFLAMVRDVAHWEQLGEVASRMLACIEQPFAVAVGNTRVSASIGIALFPGDADDFEMLVKHADLAMYQAKTLGRARYSFFHAELNARLQANLELDQQLGEAIANNQLVLHYQPQVDGASGQLVGVEALVRWQHPQRGLLHPGHFIGIAEESGKIADLGAWTLRQACAQMALWQTQGVVVGQMAVNVSALEFRDHRLLNSLQAALANSGISAGCLEIEITESVLMADTQTSQLIIDRLREIGVGIAIDDFGTGYSSLAYLKRLRPTQLKLDQSFVRDTDQDADSRAIVRGVIGLAHELGLSVVAEGVETDTQRDFLRAARCPILQGYLIARPLPAAALAQWLAERLTPEPAPPAPAIGRLSDCADMRNAAQTGVRL